MIVLAKKTLRKEMTDEILEFFDDLDPSGANTERMRKLFASFDDDKAFYKFMYDFFSDPKQNWMVAYKPYDNHVTMEFIEGVANKHGIPIYEIVYMPYLSPDPDDPVGTVNPVMVLDYPIKRLKQMVFKSPMRPPLPLNEALKRVRLSMKIRLRVLRLLKYIRSS